MILTVGNQNNKKDAKSLKAKTWMIMKLTIALLLFFTFQVNAKTHAQKVTIVKDNIHLSQVFKDIERQTGYLFFYDKDLIQKTNPIDVSIKDATLEQALHDCLEGQQLTYSIVRNTVVIQPLKAANKPEVSQLANIPPPIEIHGRIVNQQGEPLQNVSVLIEGTKTGTTTNSDGRFTLTAPDNKNIILEISSVGFQTKKVNVGKQTDINVTLELDVTGLSDVVVVGYTQRKRGEITGSISTIGSEEIEKSPTINLSRGLEGRATGLIINDRGGQPGGPDMSILIRGKGTLGNNDPLVIIDGVPADVEDLSNLSSQNIASISVLKDASAAIYGARSANGVILVTTKRGKTGTSQITVNADYGISAPTLLPKLMSSYQFAEYNNEASERYGQPLPYSENDLELYKNGSDPLTHPNTNWYNATLKKRAPQSHINVAARGGTDNVKYYLSADYSHEGSIFKGGDMYANKYQIRSNIDAKVMKYLNIGFDLYAELKKDNQPSASVGTLFAMMQYTRPTSVSIYPNGLPGIATIGLNPVVGITNKAGWNRTEDRIFRPKLSFDLNMRWITEGLSLKGVASFNYDINNNELFNNTWNQYLYNPQTDEYDQSIGASSETDKFTNLTENEVSNTQQYYNLFLNYKRTFGNHQISGFIANENTKIQMKSLNGYRRDLISDQMVYLWAASLDQQKSSGTANAFGRLSYFGSLSYNYMHKYLLDFTIRRDGSSNFPKKKRFGTFPSASIGWVISDESFMNNTKDWLNSLKLRTSYGLLGNDAVSAFQYLTQYQLSLTGSGYYIFGENPVRYDGFSQSNIPNPNITWEVSKDWDIGFDASLLNNKVTVNFDYYYDKRSGILIARNESVPDYTGISLPLENLGKVNKSGIEISANYHKTTSTWGYNIGGNFSINRNKIVFMDEAKNIPEYQKQEGHPLDSWLVYKTDGIFHTQEEVDKTTAKLDGTKPGDIRYVDINGDGVINADDKYRQFSSPIPEIQYGINLGLEYKTFSISVLIQGQAKAENYIAHERGSSSNLPIYLYSKRWADNQTDGTYPRAYQRDDFYNFSHTSDFWLYSASFIRLKNVSLSYSLPDHLLSNTAFKSIIIYLKGFNLLTLDAMSKRMGGRYYDPEMNSVPLGSNGQGAIGAYYPQQTIFVGGISIGL